ncbi:MAG: glycosyltransferase [Treponemataceae bacterium]|nr:glycosyltransferase [Treponemataceae bacterium]
MKITIVCDLLGQPNNGTTIATLNLAKFLISSKKHTVKVVSNNFEGTGIPEENQCLLPTFKMGYFATAALNRNGISFALPVKKMIKAAIEDADVVHIQLPFLIGINAAKIAKKLKKPLTASFHAQAENITSHFFNLIEAKGLNDFIYKFVYHTMYKRCDCIHFPTQFIKDVFENAQGHTTNGYVITNGVSSIFKDHKEEINNEKFTIVCSGRFSKEKAQHLLIKAVAQSKHKDQIKIIFAGSGPLAEKCRQLAINKNVDAEISFFTHDKLVEVLNHANLYVHTAFIEIEAISCLEAICCGLVPLINDAHRSATKAFALEPENLFKENDVDDLTAKIDYFFEHPEVIKKLKEEYKKMQIQFDQSECFRLMEIMFCDAISLNTKNLSK